jgi:TRAP-type uncharacterized transport system substrate-binding protein
MNRAVITGKDSSYQSVKDLDGTTFGISRLGSGSQVMASVLSMNEKWSGQPKFKGKPICRGQADFSEWAIQTSA